MVNFGRRHIQLGFMLVQMLRLVEVITLVNNNDGWAFGLVVVTALPVLLRASLSIPEVSDSVVDEQMLAAAF